MIRDMKSFLITLSHTALGAVALLGIGCAGAKFEKDWQAAVATYETGGGKNPVAGPWTGTWLSHVNAHTGDLRCLVTPTEGPHDVEGEPYEFRYHATWGKFFQGGFATTFGVKPDGKRGLLVKGKKDLGIFGDFDHEGWVKDGTFEATYASEMGDHGVFEMRRPE